ncbi:ABC transporter ATP-binding protein, partial [Clostridium sp.]|uniref:ABC transporter ATP-binding protein n=1 Tax=Clostridium sp. TaxID=1506 RepID=UPI003463D328
MLNIKSIEKKFNKGTLNETTLFNNFDLEINKGDFITIVGSNGAGKSTLLNIISGALDVDSGNIVLEGKDITTLKEHKRSKFIARVFQDPTKGTSPSMTILENLSLAENKGKRFGFSLGVNKKRIEDFKEQLSILNLGLEDKIHTKVGMLSGGQRQALSLLMATLKTPQVLLLDEHTAALDPKTSENIIELTDKIVKEKQITTIMITHNLNHAI